MCGGRIVNHFALGCQCYPYRLSKIMQPLDSSLSTDFANGSKDGVEVQNGLLDKISQLLKT